MYSWRSLILKNMFETSYNYQRDNDSHMMKNTEWGAVAYLSHSKYGINKEININNNSSYKTGYSSLPTLDQSSYPGTYGDGENYNQPYNTEVGYLASTSGNISGIYDMSGGALEHVSAYIKNKLRESGFTTDTVLNYNIKYFDIYNELSTKDSYQYRILGDATGEMGPFYSYDEISENSFFHNSWYGSLSHIVDSSYPWFLRGGANNYGTIASQFYFGKGSGGIMANASFRIVLTP